MGESISALLVEDDVRLAKLTADYLAGHAVQVLHVEDGESAILETGRKRFDVIVLDVMLPGKNGIAVCRKIRESSDVPIVMITARVEEADRVLGLETGADDYLVKPFFPRELLARMRAVVRRDRGDLAPKARTLRVGALSIQTGNRTATLANQPLSLTGAEFDLLVALAERPGRILSREQILRTARGNDEETFDRAIDVQVSRLRQKLGAHPGGESLIVTVRGVGYMLADGDAG